MSHRETLFNEPDVPRTGWPGMYYPQAPDVASAAPIRVTSGQKVQADMVMNRCAAVYTCPGVVVGFFAGQGVSVQVQNSSGDFCRRRSSLSSAPRASSKLICLPGSYRLKAYSQAGEQQLRSDVRITVEKDLTQLQLALQPAVSIPIHARMDDRAQNSGQSARSRGFRSGARARMICRRSPYT